MTVSEISQDIQRECRASVGFIMKHETKESVYQNAINVFMFRKLAELQLEINYLKTRTPACT